MLQGSRDLGFGRWVSGVLGFRTLGFIWGYKGFSVYGLGLCGFRVSIEGRLRAAGCHFLTVVNTVGLGFRV